MGNDMTTPREGLQIKRQKQLPLPHMNFVTMRLMNFVTLNDMTYLSETYDLPHITRALDRSIYLPISTEELQFYVLTCMLILYIPQEYVMGFEASQKMNKAKNPPGSAVAPKARGGSDASFGDNAAGGNTNKTNASSGMHITTTARGQAMVAKVLRAKKGPNGAQFDGSTYGDSKPTNPGFSPGKGPSGGYAKSEDVNSNMDYSGKHKRTQRNPSKTGGGIA